MLIYNLDKQAKTNPNLNNNKTTKHINNININKTVEEMFKKWANYTLRMQNIRQKYYTLLRKTINIERTRIVTNMRRKIVRGVIIGTVGIVGYVYGNQMYSQHLQMKKMKKKLMKAYPLQTYIISFQEDPLLDLQQVQIKNTQDEQQINKISNTHCIFIKDPQQNGDVEVDSDIKLKRRQQINRIKQRLGNTIIVFSPQSLDELSHAIERCNKYRHTAIVGYYPIPKADSSSNIPLNFQNLKQTLQKISQPILKKKYLVIDLSEFKSATVDSINDILVADTGIKCQQINRILENKGYQPLFQSFCTGLSLHEVITNNLPLYNSQLLINRLQNLSLISADGRRFKSSTQVETFGQIPNLTPLFVGTGGVFAIPAQANIKLIHKISDKNRNKGRRYIIQSQNLSDLVIKWRQMRQYLSANRINYKLQIGNIKDNIITVQTNQRLQLSQYIGYRQETVDQKFKDNVLNLKRKQQQNIDYIFSIDNRILEKIILHPSRSLQFYYQNNLLHVKSKPNIEINDKTNSMITNSNNITNTSAEQTKKLVSLISMQGGILVWCKDRQQYEYIKQRTDLPETGAELMKKIVQIREGIDKKHILYSHARYQKYFAKGFFRKITQIFW